MKAGTELAHFVLTPYQGICNTHYSRFSTNTPVFDAYGVSTDIRVRFGARVRALRKEKKMLQCELADKVGIQESYLSDIETAKKEPCLEVIGMLADGLGVSLRRLFWDL
jgi:DNA-binding XRE family transcriptional regulator